MKSPHEPWLYRLLLVVAFSMAASSTAAFPSWSLHLAGALSSDYIDRGYSRSPERPSVQLDLRVSHRLGWIAGATLASVQFESGYSSPDLVSGVEGRVHVGWSANLGKGWNGGLALVHYEFPEVVPDEDLSYQELDLTLRYREFAALSVSTSDDVFGSGLSSRQIELSGQLPLPMRSSLSAGLGFASFSHASSLDYFYGHFGLARSFGQLLVELDLFLSDAPEIPSWGKAFEERLVLSISMAFFELP